MGTPAQTKEKRAEYPLYEMEEKGKLILPPKIISQIQYLHSHCGKVEWSGLLLYDVIKGNPSKPENFELVVPIRSLKSSFLVLEASMSISGPIAHSKH